MIDAGFWLVLAGAVWRGLARLAHATRAMRHMSYDGRAKTRKQEEGETGRLNTVERI
jgi:hypothetical protein